jgi:hypothetical protein
MLGLPHCTGTVRDHSRMAAICLRVLGVLELLSLNLGGLLFIWFGNRVRERREGFRKASLWILGLHLAGIFFFVVWATVKGTEGMWVSVFGLEQRGPALWLVYLVAVPSLFLFGLPFWWLWQDSYRGGGTREPDSQDRAAERR